MNDASVNDHSAPVQVCKQTVVFKPNQGGFVFPRGGFFAQKLSAFDTYTAALMQMVYIGVWHVAQVRVY